MLMKYHLESKALLTAFAAIVGISASADAADIYDSAVADTPVAYDAPISWTGLYFGAGLGIGSSITDISAEYFGADETSIGGAAGNFDGIGGEGGLATLQLGYDYQLSSGLVAGVFVDYDFSAIETNLNADILNIPPLELSSIIGGSTTANADLTLENMWSVGGRLGWLSSPDTLIYGLAAYTRGAYNLSASLDTGSIPVAADLAVSGSEGLNLDVDVAGYTLGAGIETRLGGNWTLKGEYRFTQFDNESFDAGDVDIDAEPSVHSARAVLSYRFNPFHRSLDGYK